MERNGSRGGGSQKDSLNRGSSQAKALEEEQGWWLHAAGAKDEKSGALSEVLGKTL